MKILIADDDADDRVFASMALKEVNKSIEVEFAKDGEELLSQLQSAAKQRTRLPDLVLLDLNMPKKDGRAALKEIKTSSTLKHIPVIIFSTSTSDVDKKFTLENGACRYIVKPSDYQQLMNIFSTISEDLVNLA